MLIAKFGTQFTKSHPNHLTSIAKVNIWQEKVESMCAFTERFGELTLNIRNLSPKVTMHHMVITLRPGHSIKVCAKR